MSGELLVCGMGWKGKKNCCLLLFVCVMCDTALVYLCVHTVCYRVLGWIVCRSRYAR